MAIQVFSGGTMAANSGNKTLSVTPLISPILLLAAVVSVAATGTFGLTDNNADGLGTYFKIADFFGNGGANQVSLFVRQAIVPNASTFTMTSSGITGGTGGGIVIWEIGGYSLVGAASVRQSAVQSNVLANVAPVVTMPLPMLPGNMLFAVGLADANAVFNGPAGSTNYGGVSVAGPPAFTVSRNGFVPPAWSGSTYPWATTPTVTSGVAVVEMNVVSQALIANPDLSLFPKGGYQ